MREQNLQKTLFFAGIFFIFIFILTPVFYMVITSLSISADFLDSRIAFVPTNGNFRSIFSGRNLHFLSYLKNSLVVSSASAFLCVAISGMSAYAITRIKFKGHIGILLFVLAVSMFPQISLAGYLFRLISKLQWINTYQGLILPYTAWIIPLSLWILVSYFIQIPEELDKAAKIDGCSHLQILVKVLIPVAAPGLFSTLLLAFIFSFNEFMFALMLTTDYHARTVPVGIALFEGLHGEIPWGTIMAASVITTAPIILLTLIFQRYIIQGLTRGAIKE